MVGAGALGCELIKAFSLMGIGCSAEVKSQLLIMIILRSQTLTDNSFLERIMLDTPNLNVLALLLRA